MQQQYTLERSYMESAPVVALHITPVQLDTSSEVSQSSCVAQDACSRIDAFGGHGSTVAAERHSTCSRTSHDCAAAHVTAAMCSALATTEMLICGVLYTIRECRQQECSMVATTEVQTTDR